MKRILASLLAATLLLTAGLFTGCSKRGPAPAPEDVYDRIVECLEDAREANVLLFGAGLPVYPRGDAEDELVHRYYGVNDDGMQFVTPYAKYTSLDEMRAVIESVYSEEYRASLMESLFTGYVDGDMSAYMPARFDEDERSLYQNVYVDALIDTVRLYDYAGMVMEEGSYDTCIYVTIPSYTDRNPGEWQKLTLTFVFENGNWYLDSPSC